MLVKRCLGLGENLSSDTRSFQGLASFCWEGSGHGLPCTHTSFIIFSVVLNNRETSPRATPCSHILWSHCLTADSVTGAGILNSRRRSKWPESASAVPVETCRPSNRCGAVSGSTGLDGCTATLVHTGAIWPFAWDDRSLPCGLVPNLQFHPSSPLFLSRPTTRVPPLSSHSGRNK